MTTDPKQHPEKETQNLSEEVLRQRYLRKDSEGRVLESEEQMFKRVSKAIAVAERNYGATRPQIQAMGQEPFHMMSERLFLPNSPTLMNAGRRQGQLAACFVLRIDDSMASIFGALRDMALVHQSGGGTGFSFSGLRPRGDMVRSTCGVASGPVSFIEVFDKATDVVKQGGRRRGANMAILRVDHPDIVGFIVAKTRRGVLENFNISVAVTDLFMKTLKSRPDTPHAVVNPRTGDRYWLPRSLKPDSYGLSDLVPAGQTDQPCYTEQDIWNMIVINAHSTGEPGVCFICRVNRDNPTPALGRIESTNPCGEQPLLNMEACVLGSVDVSKFALPDGSDMDRHALAKTVKLAVRFLDNVIDVNHYPIPEIQANR